MCLNSVRRLTVLVSLLAVFGYAASTARAAFSDDFDLLRGELVNRSGLLSNSVDKTDIKQKKACDQSIVLIDKPAKDLGVDIKTAKKVATKMIKAFPSEFAPATAMVFSNNIVQVLLTAYQALGEDVNTEVVTLTGLLATTPDGKDKLKAAAQFTIATNLLTLAQSSLTFAQGSQLLGGALKAALKGQQAAIKGGGGGTNSACGTITQSSVTMTASNDNFNATGPLPGFAGAELVVSNGLFSVGGTDGVTSNSVAFTVDSGVTGTGTYSNVSGNYSVGSPPTQQFNITSGSMNIQGIDPAHATVCGIGNFSAVDGSSNVVAVSNYAFEINTMEVSP